MPEVQPTPSTLHMGEDLSDLQLKTTIAHLSELAVHEGLYAHERQAAKGRYNQLMGVLTARGLTLFDETPFQERIKALETRSAFSAPQPRSRSRRSAH